MTPEKVMSVLAGIAGKDPHVWVAGSAAICPALAGDIDIWALNKTQLKPEDFNADIWTELPKLDQYGELKEVAYRLETTIPAFGDAQSIKVQVMLTTYRQPWDLLDQFDVSCHCYARNIGGCLAVHPDATLPGSPVKLRGRYATNPVVGKVITDAEIMPGCECSSCAGQVNQKIIDLYNYNLERQAKFEARYVGLDPASLWLPK